MNTGSLETTATTFSLGLLADDTVLALLRDKRLEPGIPPTDRDAGVLRQAAKFLGDLALVQEGVVIRVPSGGAMRSLDSLDEALRIVGKSLDMRNLKATAHVLSAAIDRILGRVASEGDRTKLISFFESLASHTLAKSAAARTPEHATSQPWIPKLLPF